MHAYVQVYTHTYKLFLKVGFNALICKTFPKVWIVHYLLLKIITRKFYTIQISNCNIQNTRKEGYCLIPAISLHNLSVSAKEDERETPKEGFDPISRTLPMGNLPLWDPIFSTLKWQDALFAKLRHN